MSKLADRIRRASRVEPAPFGFAAAAARTVSPTLLLVVRLGGDLGKVKDAIDKGADAVIVETDAGKLQGAKIPDGAIVGVVVGSANRTDVSALREAGADFLVIEESSAAETLLDDKIGFVMSVSSETEDARLRLLGDLSLDAILTAAPTPPLTVARVLDLRRIAGMGRAPLLVEADAGADASFLQVLRESGATGIVVPASDVGKIEVLRERIASVPVRGLKKEAPADVLVPASAQTGGHDDDYDDD